MTREPGGLADVPFYCVTDGRVPRGVEAIEPVEPIRFHGWWQKLAMFAAIPFKAPQLAGKRLLYLDLDVVVTSNLSRLLERPGPFGVSPGFWTGAREEGICNSSVMVLEAGSRETVWYRGASELRIWKPPPKEWFGDQEVIELTLEPGDPAFWPDGWILSYKKDVLLPREDRRRREVRDPHRPLFDPEAAVVVACHGKPDPWEALGCPFIQKHYPLSEEQRKRVESWNSNVIGVGNLRLNRNLLMGRTEV